MTVSSHFGHRGGARGLRACLHGLTMVLLVSGLVACDSTGGTEAQDWFEGGDSLPPSEQTMRLTARILAAKGDFAQAEFLAQRLVEQYPEDPSTYTEGAEILLLQGRVADAIEIIDLGLDRLPEQATLLNDRGLCQLLAGDLVRATADFEAAYNIDPDDADFVANLALARALGGDEDAARRLWARVLPAPDVERNLEIAREARIAGP